MDRAIHGRGGINAITKERVLKMAQNLGYKPNLAARYLKAPRQVRVSVNLPARIGSFFDAVRAGIRDSSSPFQAGVDLHFRTHPALGEGDEELFREALDDGSSIGPIRRLMSIFSFAGGGDFFEKNIRLHSALEPAGSLGDLGWYCLRFALWAMNWKLPREVTGRILLERAAQGSPRPVPVEFSGELIFDGGVSAGFYSAFTVQFQQWVTVSGEKGSLRIPDFVHSANDHESAFEVNQQEIRVKSCDCVGEHSQSRAMAQEANMIRNFASQVRSGKLNLEWPEMALKTQQVMDACLDSARAGGRTISPGNPG